MDRNFKSQIAKSNITCASSYLMEKIFKSLNESNSVERYSMSTIVDTGFWLKISLKICLSLERP